MIFTLCTIAIFTIFALLKSWSKYKEDKEKPRIRQTHRYLPPKPKN